MQSFTSLAVSQLDEFLYGRSPKPLTLDKGLILGDGTVYPELNFTLPEMHVSEDTLPEVRKHYQNIIEEACARAVELQTPGLVVEFELLPPMTMNPEWGAEVTEILRSCLDKWQESDGLKSALRVTPNDIREHERPPKMRSGHLWDRMVKSFELCSKAGADLLSIESTGGKEVHDDAIINADVPAVAFALGVLGSRDMEYLWDMIVDVGKANGAIPAGDTACGFGNTAMVLAEKRYIPRVWAAVIRVMTVARSLVAYEQGAVGPSKDCAYEGPFIKAITGYPISMEGSEAACAHLSPVGNISRAVADVWSNESVQNVRLLGGMAPTVSLEQLVYATRLLNTAAQKGADASRMLRDLYVDSDARMDPQAFVLRPDVVLDLSAEIVKEDTAYKRVRRAALVTSEALREAHSAGKLDIPERELSWLEMISSEADALPEDEQALTDQIKPMLQSDKVLLEEYGL